VVSTLARTYQAAGWVAVRFNFRGVGNSAGQHDGGRGELEDLKSVLKWARTQAGCESRSGVAGFSFGGAIAAACARDDQQLSHAVLVSPALGRYGFDCRDRITCPVLLIQGENDEVLDPQLAYEWSESGLASRVQLHRLPDTGHFYHGRLPELKKILSSYLESQKSY
jgi:alpha/beta superfamily hydrolase